MVKADAGNARVAIEKVVAKLSDIPPLYSLLPRSAIGQNITTYFNMITGPRPSHALSRTFPSSTAATSRPY